MHRIIPLIKPKITHTSTYLIKYKNILILRHLKRSLQLTEESSTIFVFQQIFKRTAKCVSEILKFRSVYRLNYSWGGARFHGEQIEPCLRVPEHAVNNIHDRVPGLLRLGTKMRRWKWNFGGRVKYPTRRAVVHFALVDADSKWSFGNPVLLYEPQRS